MLCLKEKNTAHQHGVPLKQCHWDETVNRNMAQLCMASLHFIMHLLKISRDPIVSFANRNVNSSCEFGKLLGTVDDIQNKGRTEVQAAIDLCYKA